MTVSDQLRPLDAADQRPFSKGINRLRHELQHPNTIERIARSGTTQINLVAGLTHKMKYADLFGNAAFQAWDDGQEFFGVPRPGDPISPETQRKVRQMLGKLCTLLDTPSVRSKLVAIGPCALVLQEDPQRFVICNYVRDARPGMDCVLNMDGTFKFFDRVS